MNAEVKEFCVERAEKFPKANLTRHKSRLVYEARKWKRDNDRTTSRNYATPESNTDIDKHFTRITMKLLNGIDI